jgi:hypothetical protein
MKTVVFGRFFAVSCLVLFAAGAGAVETIAGQVTHQVTTAGLVGIDMDVFDSAGNTLAGVTATTGAGGNYTVTLPGPGTYYVRADASLVDGVADEYYNNSFLKSGAAPIVVNANQTVNNINFALPPGFTISGTITSQSSPLLNIDIDVFHSTGELLGSYNATSLTGGAYTIGALPPGSYIVRADPDPALNQFYLRTYYNGTTDIATATLVTITSSNRTGINIDVAPGGTIAGTVRSALNAAPLAGIDLDLFNLAGNRVNINESSGANGAYEIGPVAAGSYVLRADPTLAQGYARTYYLGVAHFGDATPIPVTVGQRNSGKDFSLGLSGTISGTITVQGSGTPLTGIDLDVFDSQGRLTDYNATSGAGGAYQIGPVFAGQYYVRANPTLAQAYADEYYNNKIDLNLGNLVTVSGSANTPGINFTLVLGGTITGTVRNTLAQPISGIDLDIFDAVSGTRLRKGATSAANGTYQFDRLTPGTYIVRADPTAAQGYATQYYNGKLVQAAADAVTVSSSTTTPGVDFALANGGTVSGRVTQAGLGMAIANMDLDVYDANTLVKLGQTTKTNSQGYYTLSNLPAGQYFVAADPVAGQPYFVEYYNGAPTSGTATVLTVSGGGSITGINFQLDIDVSQLPSARSAALCALSAALIAMACVILMRRKRGSRGA